MDGGLTPEQEMFRAAFGAVARKEIAPLAAEMDQAEKLSVDVWRTLAGQGWLGALTPEKWGGAALDAVSYSLLVEEAAQVCMAAAVMLAHHCTLTRVIDVAGAAEQQARWLPELASGQLLGALAISEPDAGSDVSLIATRAKRAGDEYVLEGVKSWVLGAGLAGVYVVLAREAPQQLAAFVVQANAPGVQLGARELTLGLRAVSIHTLYLDGVRVPAGQRLGNGADVLAQVWPGLQLALAAVGLGVAEAALAAGIGYAAERVQFGGPIALKQAIQSYLADAAVRVEALRQLVYHAARQEGREGDWAAMYAKLYAAETAHVVTDKMVQVHGGYGYMEDYPIARMYRDARVLSLLGSADQVLRVDVARHLLPGLAIAP
jgi:alkylation response protein AidB-like acyl-CoA dehydrogenase